MRHEVIEPETMTDGLWMVQAVKPRETLDDFTARLRIDVVIAGRR